MPDRHRKIGRAAQIVTESDRQELRHDPRETNWQRCEPFVGGDERPARLGRPLNGVHGCPVRAFVAREEARDSPLLIGA